MILVLKRKISVSKLMEVKVWTSPESSNGKRGKSFAEGSRGGRVFIGSRAPITLQARARANPRVGLAGPDGELSKVCKAGLRVVRPGA